MSGPTPITATHRLSFSYVTATLTHTLRMYCALTASGLDPTGYVVDIRTGPSTLGASVAIDRVWTLLAPFFNAADVTFGTVVLEQRSGGAFVPLTNYATAVVPTGGGGTKVGVQDTFFFYSTDRTRHKFIFLEPKDPAPGKANSLAGLPGYVVALINAFSVGGAAGDPWLWTQSRDGAYIGSWLSLVTTLNRKTRRRRGLA